MAFFEVRGGNFVGYIRVNANPNAVLTASGRGIYTAVADSSGNAIIKVLRSGTYEISSNLSNRKCTATVSQYAQVVDAVYKWNRYYIQKLYTYVDSRPESGSSSSRPNTTIENTMGTDRLAVMYDGSGANINQTVTAFDTYTGRMTFGSDENWQNAYYNLYADAIPSRFPASQVYGVGRIKFCDSAGGNIGYLSGYFSNPSAGRYLTENAKYPNSWVLHHDGNTSTSVAAWRTQMLYSYHYSNTNGAFIDNQYAHGIGAYPDNYIQGDYWYIAQ